MRKAKRPPARNCIICGRYFKPKPFAYSQKVCSRKSCREKRKRDNFQNWKKINPDYYKTKNEGNFSEYWRERRKIYRKKNPNCMKNWRKYNRNKYRDYMKKYMKTYRRNSKVKRAVVSSSK